MKASALAGGVYRVAFRFAGLPCLPLGTNAMSREFPRLAELASPVQLVAEYDRDEFGTPEPRAIRIAFEIAANSADDAAERGYRVADLVWRVIAFQAGAPYVRPVAVALLDVTPGLSHRFYRQWCYRPELGKPTREIMVSEIEATAFSLAHRLDRERDAIMLGLKWYTDALTEHDALDRFLKAWVGLESIGAIINRRSHGSGWRTCRKCLGDAQAREKDEKQERGIRHVFSVTASQTPHLFDTLRRARNKLVHAEWGLTRVRQAIEPHADLATLVLTRGLLTAIAPPGVSAGSREAFEPALPSDPAVFCVSLDLLTSDPNTWGELSDKLNVKTHKVSSETRDGQYRARAKFDIHGEFPCDFENLRLEAHGARGNAVVLEVDDAPELFEVYQVRPDGSAHRIR